MSSSFYDLLGNEDLMYTARTDLEEKYFDTVREIASEMYEFDPNFIAGKAKEILASDGNELLILMDNITKEDADLLFECVVCELISNAYNNKTAYRNAEESGYPVNDSEYDKVFYETIENKPMYASQFVTVLMNLSDTNDKTM